MPKYLQISCHLAPDIKRIIWNQDSIAQFVLSGGPAPKVMSHLDKIWSCNYVGHSLMFQIEGLTLTLPKIDGGGKKLFCKIDCDNFCNCSPLHSDLIWNILDQSAQRLLLNWIILHQYERHIWYLPPCDDDKHYKAVLLNGFRFWHSYHNTYLIGDGNVLQMTKWLWLTSDIVAWVPFIKTILQLQHHSNLNICENGKDY